MILAFKVFSTAISREGLCLCHHFSDSSEVCILTFTSGPQGIRWVCKRLVSTASRPRTCAPDCGIPPLPLTELTRGVHRALLMKSRLMGKRLGHRSLQNAHVHVNVGIAALKVILATLPRKVLQRWYLCGFTGCLPVTAALCSHVSSHLSPAISPLLGSLNYFPTECGTKLSLIFTLKLSSRLPLVVPKPSKVLGKGAIYCVRGTKDQQSLRLLFTKPITNPPPGALV